MASHYNVFQPQEAHERESGLYPHPISAMTQVVFRNVGLLKYYEEATSLKAHSILLEHLIYRWNIQE